MADPFQETSPPQRLWARLSTSLAVDAVFLPAKLPDRDSLLRQREDRAGRGDAAQYVLAKRDQGRCGLGSDRA